MVFPIGDDQIRGGHKPYFAYGFIALNVAIFLLQLTSPGQLVCEWAAIPDEILTGNRWITVLTSMFMHGGWMHLIGNMMFLWVFADNIEATIGNFNFMGFYLLGGLAGSLAHIFFSTGGVGAVDCCTPCSNLNPCPTTAVAGQVVACARYIPALGASGAISAVLGAYLVMFPKSNIKVFFFFRVIYMSAFIFLGLWFVQQLIPGLSGGGGGVAWWAHIGGFVFGVLVGLVARKSYLKTASPTSPTSPAPPALQKTPVDDDDSYV